MIDVSAPIRTSYYSALNGNVTVTLPIDGSTTIEVYSQVPDETAYPYISIADITEEGAGEAMTKDDPYATDVLVSLIIVTAFQTSEDNAENKIADDIANAILAIVLAATPLTFTGLKNKISILEESEYDTARNDTHLVIARKLVIRHVIGQA